MINLAGKRFGRLVVVDRDPACGTDKGIFWNCVCDCGKVKKINGRSLRNGNTTSCGCWKDEKTRARFHKHGDSKSRLYDVWSAMKRRCGNTSSKDFFLYGGRGITVCSEWENDYGAFQAWAIENGYQKGLRLDRRDNDGKYCPQNCRWVDDFIQANNRRDNRYIEYRGETYSMSDLSRIAVVSYTTLRTRLNLGWGIESAVNVPAVRGRNQYRVAL